MKRKGLKHGQFSEVQQCLLHVCMYAYSLLYVSGTVSVLISHEIIIDCLSEF